jgi:hypothetical protein
MPARIHPLFRRASFDAETLHVMGGVYDGLRQEMFELDDVMVAEAVLQAAETGERESDKLQRLAEALLGAAGRI